MSVSFSLCIRTGHTDIDDLAQELSQILDIPLTPLIDMDEKLYEYRAMTEIVRLWHNYLESDGNIDFESYQFVLGLWARYENSSGYVESSQQFGERIFEVLKQSQNYDLLFVRDVQEVLLRYERPSPSTMG